MKRVLYKILLFIILTALLPLLSNGKPRIYESKNYRICSSVSPEQTRHAVYVAEALKKSYSAFLDEIDIKAKPSNKHKLRIYRNRNAYKSAAPLKISLSEGAYDKDNHCCYLYIDFKAPNPYHWMTHECTHQLNNELANLTLNLWLEEGLTTYFASSRIINGQPKLGTMDTNTYPAFHWHLIATNGNLELDKKNGSIIPLKTIIANNSNQNDSAQLNLYYLHYWTLTHFIFHAEGGKYRKNISKLLLNKNNVAGFEKWIGPINEIEPKWYSHVNKIKTDLKTTKTPAVKLNPDVIPEEFIVISK